MTTKNITNKKSFEFKGWASLEFSPVFNPDLSQLKEKTFYIATKVKDATQGVINNFIFSLLGNE